MHYGVDIDAAKCLDLRLVRKPHLIKAVLGRPIHLDPMRYAGKRSVD